MTLMQTVFWLIATLGNVLAFATWLYFPSGASIFLACLIALYTIIGLYDVFVSPHNLNRLYPVVAYIRYFLENFRTEIQQYFIASNTSELPFNREQRDLVYQRSKGIRDTIAFGTQRNLLEAGYLSLWHAMIPKEVNAEQQRVVFGGEQCLQPYNASYLNISAMSFGALSSNAIEALNLGAKLGGFFHNTGEGGVSPYHLKHGGDLVWQIGSGLFGCRNEQGLFDAEKFKAMALRPQIKMIEIKLSQGAKPGHGGVLPKEKISAEIAEIRGVTRLQDCVSPAAHPCAQTPMQLLNFIQTLRQLSEGKPIGFKLCLGNPAEFLSLCKAMLQAQIYPDFITIDGAEGGTGAAPVEFSNRLGMTCLEAVYIIHNALIGCNIRQHIKLIAAGKTASSFDLLAKIAVGADTVNAARTMMMALGCIQSRSCNSNMCPTGIATQDDARGKAIDVPLKGKRVQNFHQHTLHNFYELVGSMGLDTPKKLMPHMIKRRNDQGILEPFDLHLPMLKNCALINSQTLDEPWKQWWNLANEEHFEIAPMATPTAE